MEINLNSNIMERVSELKLEALMLVTIIFNTKKSGSIVMEWILNAKEVWNDGKWLMKSLF